jgi:ATP-dependent DNA helicase RecQ
VPPPSLPELPAAASPETLSLAKRFLADRDHPVEPRAMWPGGGLKRHGVRGKIPEALRFQPGRALSVWDDGAWGSMVSKGKYSDGRFDDWLVKACLRLLGRWSPTPRPEWITCVPSHRRPDLVPEFAARLAGALKLPFHPALVVADPHAEQKTMRNSNQQARNVDGAFAVNAAAVRRGPVLLVDDVVDSRWTLAVCSWLLLANGSGPVHPLALSLAGSDD